MQLDGHHAFVIFWCLEYWHIRILHAVAFAVVGNEPVLARIDLNVSCESPMPFSTRVVTRIPDRNLVVLVEDVAEELPVFLTQAPAILPNPEVNASVLPQADQYLFHHNFLAALT